MDGQRFDAFTRALARGTSRRRMISSALVALLGGWKGAAPARAVAPGRMALVQPAEGWATPFDADGQPYPRFGHRTPALHSFYLGFDEGDASPDDHEIALIQVLAGGTAEDLSPQADLEPSTIPDGRLHVALQDAEPTGERFFYRVSHAVLDLPGARRYQIRDVGCRGVCRRELPVHIFPADPGTPPPLIALVGFKLFFTGGRDHELDRVGVWFEDRTLVVAFQDKNGDDVFGYLVDFVVIPRGCLNVSTGTKRGTTGGGKRFSFPTPPDTDFLLRGWALNFQRDDHEIRDIGIDRRGDDITVYYADKNADDRFDWRIEWAHVGPVPDVVDEKYAPDLDPDLMNPERGMYFEAFPGEATLPDGTPDPRRQSHTIVPRWLHLDTVCDEELIWDRDNPDLSSPVLTKYAAKLEEVRTKAGETGIPLKVLFRPRYDRPAPDDGKVSHCGLFHADDIERQKRHINEVAKMLADYKDVIAFIQAGYLGNWGEWNTAGGYDTVNAPLLYHHTVPTDISTYDRSDIIVHVLSAYAAEGIAQDVELRTPVLAKEVVERYMLDKKPLPTIGLHNDCFMTTDDDYGTYSDFPQGSPQDFGSVTDAKDWAEDLTENSSFGGETCPVRTTSSPYYLKERWRFCANMIGVNPEPASLHMSYLNGDYAADNDPPGALGAVSTWDKGDAKGQTCYDEIRRRLGYRFEVKKVEYTPMVAAGQTFRVSVDIENTGWARLHKPRVAKLVLRDGSTAHPYIFSPHQVENWAPGQTTTITVNASAPSAGTYRVRLWIPDPDAEPPAPENPDGDDPEKKRRIAYAVKLATLRIGKVVGLPPRVPELRWKVFDPDTGENDLGVSITVCR